MSKENNGWSAFPIPKDRLISATEFNGMTLWDYSAAKTMQGIYPLSNDSDREIAEKSYRMADAMLEARDK
jgi:hypothetical protein